MLHGVYWYLVMGFTIFKGQAISLLTLEDGTETSSWNVDNQLPIYAA